MRIDEHTMYYGSKIANLVHSDAQSNNNGRWTDLLESYEWGNLKLNETNTKLDAFAKDIEDVVVRIFEDKSCDSCDLDRLIIFANQIFSWGHVKSGESKQNLSGNEVRDVIYAAVSWSILKPGGQTKKCQWMLAGRK